MKRDSLFAIRYLIPKQLARVIVVSLRRVRRLRRWWYKIAFELQAIGSLESFSCKSGLKLHVPVRFGDGAGTLIIGDNVTFGYCDAPRMGNGAILLQPRSPNACIQIGDGTYVSNNVSIVAMNSVQIGQNCLIGDMVGIFDCDFHDLDPVKRHTDVGRTGPVNIENGVWLGSRVMVLRGVTIGENSVIGTGSVVTRSIPANVVAAGNPAKELRKL